MVLRVQESLSVVDSRTNKSYTIPITDNTISASDFEAIKATRPEYDGEFPVDAIEEGLKIFDLGLKNTACVDSKVSYIDGKQGYMQVRDRSIDELFRNNDYEEVLFLLIWGHLPSAEEKSTTRKALALEMTQVPQSAKDAIRALPKNASMGPMILAGLSAYVAVDEEGMASKSQLAALYQGNIEAVDRAVVHTLAAVATCIALAYCHTRGKEFTPARADGTFIGNTLLMMGKVDADGNPDARLEGVLEKLWVLYAEHGLSNSTATMLCAASTLTDPISASIAGIVSAYGPLHGGAIDLAYHQLKLIGTPENVPPLIAAVKAKKQRLFGYGHRIYKKADPRCKFLYQMIKDTMATKDANKAPQSSSSSAALGEDARLLEVALTIDRVASTDEYFTSRQLVANADLLGALLYSSLGFERDLILPLAVQARMAGAMAHWREVMTAGQGPAPLWRPLQLFSGIDARDEVLAEKKRKMKAQKVAFKNAAEQGAETREVTVREVAA
ncbi:citrate synthase [Apiospora arundinis]|uniref:Citrate synthase n=1 Tax=Apiospora arundinis TaxID=335852 RepID=A0ABR2JC64_9PEZI